MQRSAVPSFSRIALLAIVMSTGPAVGSDPAAPLSPEWERALRSDRTLVRLMGAENRSETELARWAQRLERLSEESSGWIPAEERSGLCLDLWQSAVRTTWIRQRLAPSVVIPPEEIEAEYRSARRAGLDRASGVKVLEIFLWAPEDLPDLRRARLDLARSIRETASSPDRFAAAAEEYSDATSYFKGGRIGTLHADRIDGRLRAVLFTGRTGPTEIIETGDGIYLFFVTAEVPARTHDPAAVRKRIEKGLHAEKVRSILPARLDVLAAELDGRLTVPTPDGSDEPAFTIGQESFPLDPFAADPGLDPAARARAIRRAFETQLMAVDLDRAGIPLPSEDSPACILTVAHRIVDAMVESEERNEPAVGPDPEPSQPVRPQITRSWSFDVVFVSPVTEQRTWFEVFRAVRTMDSSPLVVDPEAIAAALAAIDPPVAVRIERFRDVAPSDAAHLGPEIHTSLRRFLQPGDPPRVLHLADAGQAAVVIMLDSSERPVAATPAPDSRRDRQRSHDIRRAVYRRILDGEEWTSGAAPAAAPLDPDRPGGTKKAGDAGAPPAG